MWRLSLLFVGACSFAFMSQPQPVMPPDCSDRYEAPVTDTVIGGAAFGLASTIGAASIVRPASIYALSSLVVLVPIALLNGTSAVYGYISRSNCEHSRADAETAR